MMMGSSRVWASQSYEVSIPGMGADIRCDLDETNGRVRMLLNMSGHVAVSDLLKRPTLVAELGNETWAQPDAIQKSCRSQKKELLARPRITGTVWVEKKQECICAGLDCTVVESHYISFGPLKANGYQHYSFTAMGINKFEDPSCHYQEPNQ